MFEDVCKILSKQLNVAPADITLSSKIKDDLGADSLDILQLLMTIEDEKGITIPDEELAAFTTVGDVVAYLEKQA
jgi:acyl carrier protein